MDGLASEHGESPGRDIVVVGASAGGVEALTAFCRGLPADLPAAIFTVLHVPAISYSVLPSILERAGPLPAHHAEDGDPIERGRIYVAPPDHHLMLREGAVRLSRGPRENRHRPAIDPLFRSAARWHGQRVVGIVLSGTLDDGSSGLIAIKRRGGIAVAQDPDEALFDAMPRSAMRAVDIDAVLPASGMGEAIAAWAREPMEGRPPGVDDALEREVRFAEGDPDMLSGEHHNGVPANLGCPECGGTLWQVQENALIRFRCRVGHAYTAQTLQAEQDEALEGALWVALRTLEEQASLARRLRDNADRIGHRGAAERFGQQAQDALERAETVRKALGAGRPPGWNGFAEAASAE